MDNPRDYTAIRRLVLLDVKARKTSAAWERLDKCYDLFSVGPVVPVRTWGFSIQEVLESFEFLPQYCAYRNVHPISDYWDREDPLYDLPFAPPRSKLFQAVLTTFCAIPFGLGSRYINSQPISRRGRTVVSMFDAVRLSLERAIVESARELAAVVPAKNWAKDLPTAFAKVLMFVGLVSLREFSRQRGWIATHFRVPNPTLMSAMDKYDEAQIANNVLAKALLRIAKELKSHR